MAIVMEQKGTLDTNTLAQVMGVTPQVARERLLAARSTDPETGDEYPLVFEPHNGGDLVPAADYLSGNVRARLEEAQALAADDSRFDINVQQLEAVLPPDITPGEIDAPMGAAWLGGDIVQAFLRDKLNSDTVRVSYQGGSLWKVDAPDGVKKAGSPPGSGAPTTTRRSSSPKRSSPTAASASPTGTRPERRTSMRTRRPRPRRRPTS
ncbi:hypothetical protein HFP70_35855 [Streptomyces sp. ARC14]|uniref:hypothetical protein n=1 Tax=Streptomyces sp. ARC14 TaxID=2724152 RepID=UPI0038577609